MDDPELFDPQTRDRVRRDIAKGTIVVFALATLVVAGMTAGCHHEMPVLARAAGSCAPDQYAYECAHAGYDVLAGALGFLAFGAFAAFLYRHRRIPPTVHCRSCGRAGWVMDLEPREGRCPRCGGSRFAYRTVLVGTPPEGRLLHTFEESDADGAALVERFRATRRSLWDRYY